MIKFPFETKRKYQDEIIGKVEECLNSGNNLLVHAPTGIGKTVSVLYPSVKFAVEYGFNLFFITPRHSQHQIALETMEKIGNVKTVDLIGKRWLCSYNYDNELSQSDFQELCNYLKKEEKCKYYNQVWSEGELTDKAISKLRSFEKISSSEKIKRECKDFCPYEISCLLARSSTVIIGDYFHLFSPSASKSFLMKINKELENSIVIVDEAHQLPHRVRSHLSSKLTTYILDKAWKEAKEFNPNLANEIYNLNLKIEEIAKEKLCEVEEAYIEKRELVSILNSIGSDFLKGLYEVSDAVKENGKEKSFCHSIANFIDKWIESDEDFTRIIKKVNDKKYEINLVALLPSKITSGIINSTHSTILMSATLQPTEMYANLLGVKNYESISFPSVFPKENRLNIISPIVTTRYSKRDKKQYKKYADIISKIFENISGNVAVFFPSYYFLERVREYIEIDNLFVEKPRMSKEQKVNLLKNFVNSKKSLLLAVFSGSFDQGVDFPNNILKGVIIAGLPLAKPDLETKSLIECYNRYFGKGIEYGYIYPAIQKSIQASGRAIRKETDKAAIVYLDERFLWKNYRNIFSDGNFIVSNEPWIEVKRFNL